MPYYFCHLLFSLSQGLASAFLPLLHAAFMSYSLPLSKYLAESGVELYGRSDLRFVEGLYKVVRALLSASFLCMLLCVFAGLCHVLGDEGHIPVPASADQRPVPVSRVY